MLSSRCGNHELTAAMVNCVGPKQDPASQNPSINTADVLQALEAICSG